MWLAVSAGNTNVAWAPVAEGRLVGPRRLTAWRSLAAPAAEALAAELKRIAGTLDEPLDGIVVASVVPAASAAAARVAMDLGIALLEAGPGTIPLPVRAEAPERIGADRLVNAYAARRLYGAPAIVVDLGTATTVDAVGADGAFLGGAIAAGPQLGLDALSERTALLPRAELGPVETAIGRDTASAMRSGAVLGQLGLVRELVARIRHELEAEGGARPVRVVATGGHAASPWAAGLPVDEVDPDLTLAGLALLEAERAGSALAPGPARSAGRNGPPADAPADAA